MLLYQRNLQFSLSLHFYQNTDHFHRYIYQKSLDLNLEHIHDYIVFHIPQNTFEFYLHTLNLVLQKQLNHEYH